MEVNYFGTLHAIRAVAPSMIARRSGSIVLIGSGAGLIGLFGYTAYAPSKFALRGLAESLRGEMKRHGVRVAIAYPPDTETPQLEEEEKTKPPETKRITAGGGRWQAGAVGEAILAGVDAGRFSIDVGWQMRWLRRLHSPLGGLLQGHFDRLAGKGDETS